MKNIYKYFLDEDNFLGLFFVLSFVFYMMTYLSVGSVFPNAIPVHHDDYSNYARTLAISDLSLIRPLSTLIIQILSDIHPELLIYAVRFLTIAYVFFIFYLLSEVFKIKLNLVSQVIISIIIFSTPILVEYSRYTGMITHLISGNLALLSIILLHKSITTRKLFLVVLSSVLMFLSIISKEDFILFYLVAVFYIIFTNNSEEIIDWRIKSIILIGIVFIFSAIIFSKTAVSSSFLGTTDSSSTYYLNVLPSSIIDTIVKYLSGANHPSLEKHGQFVILIFLFSLFFNIFYLREKNINGFFIILFSILIILPYSVLPNHINAYYELLWLPFIYISFFISLGKFLKDISFNKFLYIVIVFITFLIFLALLIVDYQPRKSIANWYDTISLSNKNNIKMLIENRDVINKQEKVCILGADSFSPWFMHNGNYLNNVLKIDSLWFIVPLSEEIKEGFLLSEQMNDKIKIVESCPENILKIDMRHK